MLPRVGRAVRLPTSHLSCPPLSQCLRGDWSTCIGRLEDVREEFVVVLPCDDLHLVHRLMQNSLGPRDTSSLTRIAIGRSRTEDSRLAAEPLGGVRRDMAGDVRIVHARDVPVTQVYQVLVCLGELREFAPQK